MPRARRTGFTFRVDTGALPGKMRGRMSAPRVIFHLDMDAFYASVEQRDNPEWRGQPVIVGGSPERRGVVCAASYEARKFGVRSAMASATAWRLCPAGVFVRPRMEVYRDESRAIMEIVRSYGGELMQQVSVDEAYVEVTPQLPSLENHDALLESAEPLALRVKQAIHSAGDSRRRSASRLTSSSQRSPPPSLSRTASPWCGIPERRRFYAPCPWEPSTAWAR